MGYMCIENTGSCAEETSTYSGLDDDWFYVPNYPSSTQVSSSFAVYFDSHGSTGDAQRACAHAYGDYKPSSGGAPNSNWQAADAAKGKFSYKPTGAKCSRGCLIWACYKSS